jgi:uncharacterized membrane protein YuzA (DUF378 family)
LLPWPNRRSGNERGLCGSLNLDLVAAIFGCGWFFARAVYVVVALSAIHQALTLRKLIAAA